jgi:hypothetical protein
LRAEVRRELLELLDREDGVVEDAGGPVSLTLGQFRDMCVGITLQLLQALLGARHA